MIRWRDILAAVFAMTVVVAPLYADMMPLSLSDGGCRQSARSPKPTDLLNTDGSALPDRPGIAGLGVLPVGALPGPGGHVEQACETQAPPILSDGQNSFSLCLYALLGLGLCRSAPWVKKLHFGAIPEWYHDGGPSQIGHSLAISPDCLCSAPVYCFVQPEDVAEDLSPQYDRGVISPLLRESLFTPTVLASRAPPFCSC